MNDPKPKLRLPLSTVTHEGVAVYGKGDPFESHYSIYSIGDEVEVQQIVDDSYVVSRRVMIPKSIDIG